MTTLLSAPYIRTRTGFVKVELQFNWHDLWVGVFWKRYPKALDLFVCLIPCLPVEIYHQWDMR